MKYASLAVAFAILATARSGFSQTEKQIGKYLVLFEKKPKKAADKLRKRLERKKWRTDAPTWEVYVKMRRSIYETKRQSVLQSSAYSDLKKEYTQLLLLRDSLNTGHTERHSLKQLREVNAKMEFLNQLAFERYAIDYEHYVFACREASLQATPVLVDVYLREMFLPVVHPDTSLMNARSTARLEQFYLLLDNRQLNEAHRLLDTLMGQHPTSYHVNMTSYLYHYQKEQYDSAVFYLKKTIHHYPTRVEPRENLAQLFFSQGNIYRAKEQVEELMLLYPGQDMKEYYQQLLYTEEKQLKEHRITRPVFPNQIGVHYPFAKGHWKDYQEAKYRVAPFTALDGMIRKNEITREKYLEVYCWKKMLDRNRHQKPDELLFAYEMEEKGLLDCYVFYSNFHIDLIQQVQNFVQSKENRLRMKKMIADHLVVLVD